MSSSIPLQVAETLQTLSINPHPSPEHDMNPSTAASPKVPVTISHHNSDMHSYSSSILGSDIDEDEDEDVNYSVIRPRPRRASLPPLPDLRFEQSYLASIAGADTVGRVIYITIRDQVLLPLLQGTIWTLALSGWRYWNRGAKLSGQSMGSRLRRWWWGVNNWPLDKSAASVLKSNVADKGLAGRAEEFYKT